jgi:trigger factor
MNVTVKSLPKSEVKLTVEVSDEKLQKYYEKAARQISNMVKIPGFRPGHVPLDILKSHVKDEAIENHMLDIALPELYSEAVVKEKIQAVSRPKVEIISMKPLKFEATVAVYPVVEISGYDKIQIKKNDAKVTEKDVEEVLDDIRKRHATYNEVEREAKKGDKVEIDFEGFDEEGKSLENTKSKDHPLVIGEGSLVPGFEEALIGMKKGENKTFDVEFPKDYFHKPFQGKKVRFKAEMKKILEVGMPEFTQEFITRITGADKSLDEVKKNIEENLKHDKEYQEKVRRENEFLEKIISLTKVETPEILIEEEIDGMIDEFKSDLEQRGIPMDKYLEQSKKKIEDIRKDRRKEAENRLRLRFGLQKMFEQEKIEVTDAELKKEIEHVISLYPKNEQYKVRGEYKEGSYLMRRLENKMRMDKLFERFLDK